MLVLRHLSILVSMLDRQEELLNAASTISVIGMFKSGAFSAVVIGAIVPIRKCTRGYESISM